MLKNLGNLLLLSSFIVSAGLIATSSLAATSEAESGLVGEANGKTVANISTVGKDKLKVSAQGKTAVAPRSPTIAQPPVPNSSTKLAATDLAESQQVAEPNGKTVSNISSGDRAKLKVSKEAEAIVAPRWPAIAQPAVANYSTNSSRIAQTQNSSSKSATPAPALTTSDTLSIDDSEPDTMEQVTSISELKDVQPTDWAFQALQSMVERYGCISGYPDSTYRGNRALSRYEFAAGLNKCLEQIQTLIAKQPQGVSKEDLEKLQKLQQDFAAELANLKNRIDALEPRVATLEKQQFSTTAQLHGITLTFLSDAFGNKTASQQNNLVFNYRSILTLTSSFTGQDNLTVGLQAGNWSKLNTATNFPQGIRKNGTPLNGSTDETRFFSIDSFIDSNGNFDSTVQLNLLQYRFPIGDKVLVVVDAVSNDRIISPSISQLNNPALGPLSYYGQTEPMLYPFAAQSGIGLSWKTASWLKLDFTAASEYGSSNYPSSGLLQSGYSVAIRPVIELGHLKLSASYINAYSPSYGVDTVSGSNAAKIQGAGPVGSNTYVAAATYQFTPTFQLSATVGYLNARTLGYGTRGDAQVMDYGLGLTFSDLGKKGNLAGLILGTEPRLIGTSNDALAQAIGLPAGQRSDRSVGYHIEAFWTYQLSDNIAITPGVFWLTAPNHDDRNPSVVVGAIRTSFFF